MEPHHKSGYIAGFTAYLIWGLLPIYWKLLPMVPAMEMLAWRVAGCGVVAWVFLLLRRKPVNTSALNRKVAFRLLLAALLIAGNWGTYIWAVATERILQASLGYYMNPLVNVVLGVAFFSERLGKVRIAALGLALVGVVLMTLDAGTFPWISILLALQFGFYGMAVKVLPAEIDSIEVLGWETIILSPIAAAYLAWLGLSGEGLNIVGSGPLATGLLLGAGIVTFVPLWLFGTGAKHIPLSAMGFLQYIAPTLMLLLGVLVYGEPFSPYRAAAFGLVLAALTIYTISMIKDGISRT